MSQEVTDANAAINAESEFQARLDLFQALRDELAKQRTYRTQDEEQDGLKACPLP